MRFRFRRHKHKWDTLRVVVEARLSGFETLASQKCWECGKTRHRTIRGKFTPEEIDG